MKRLECLDGLRGVLAVYVMLGHMAPFSALPSWIAGPLSHGGAAVDVFFILSGLVILRSLESCRFAARPFLISRIARIFPVYLAMLALGIAVQTLPGSFDAMPWVDPDSLARDIWSQGWPRHWLVEIAAHLTMTHGLFPNGVLPDVWVSFLGAAWSLSTEWQFYVLALLLGRSRLGAERLAGAFLVLAAIGLAWDMTAPDAWRFSRAFLPNKAQYFALGIASGVWIDRRSIGSFGLVLIGTLILCAAHGQIEKLLPPLIWALCLAAQLFPERLRVVAAPLRWRTVQWLGAVSYPIYLANEPIQKLLGIVLARIANGDAMLFTLPWLPAAVVLPIAVAALLHRFVETPAQRWGRTMAHRGDRLLVTPAGAVPEFALSRIADDSARTPVGLILAGHLGSTIDREEFPAMPPTLTDAALEYLLQSAGLTLTEAEKADLQSVHDGLAAMKARVRQKRGPMAELAHGYGFTAEDLS